MRKADYLMIKENLKIKKNKTKEELSSQDAMIKLKSNKVILITMDI